MNELQEAAGYEVFSFKIPEFRVKDTLSKLKKLSSKAQELGLPAFSIAMGEPEIAKRVINKRPENLSVIPIQVTGGVPKIPGWRFIAKIDHDEINEVKGFAAQKLVEEDPEMFAWLTQCEPNCQHCNLKRNRNTTFLFQSDSDPGERIQVGSSCIDDFSGHKSPELLLSMANRFAEVIDELDDEDGMSFGGGAFRLFEAESILAAASAIVRVDGGWVSKDRATEFGSTTDWVQQVVLDPKEYRKIVLAGDEAQGEKVLNWLRSDDFEVGTDLYRSNLRAMAMKGYVSAKAIGFLGSAVATYARDHRMAERRENARKNQVSMTLGEVGEKLNVDVAIDKIIPIDTFYGLSRLHIMRELETGAKITWFSSGAKKFNEGGQYRITGRVKGYEERDGIKETRLARVNSPDLALHNKIQPEMNEKDLIKKAKKLKHINACDGDGENLIHVVSHVYRFRDSGRDLILSLLDQGANPGLVSFRDGMNAFDYWMLARDAELIQLGLERYPELAESWSDANLNAYGLEDEPWIKDVASVRDRVMEQKAAKAEEQAAAGSGAKSADASALSELRGGMVSQRAPEPINSTGAQVDLDDQHEDEEANLRLA